MFGKSMLICILVVAATLSGLGQAAERTGAFGNGIPLALIEEMLPADDIKIEIADGVDRNIRIDWTDSDNWMLEFLKILEGQGLRVVMRSKSIVIERMDAAADQPENRHANSPAMEPIVGEDMGEGTWNSVELQQFDSASSTNSEPELQLISRKGFKIIPFKEEVEKEVEAVAAEGVETTEAEPPAMTAAPSALPSHKPAVLREPAAPVQQSKYFAKSGETLHATLQRWAAADSWTIVWRSNFDYVLEADAEFAGDFVAVASEIVRIMSDAESFIKAEFYTVNKVLTVSSSLDEFVN